MELSRICAIILIAISQDDPDLLIIHVLVNHTKNLLRNSRDKINDNSANKLPNWY